MRPSFELTADNWPMWSGSANGSTASRSPSSWRRRARSCCRHTRSCPGSTPRSTSVGRAVTVRRVIRRCATPSVAVPTASARATRPAPPARRVRRRGRHSSGHGRLPRGRAPFYLLDRVAEIVDASLAQVVDHDDGEPRIGMLETIRSFAAELLEASNDRVEVRDRHAGHFAAEVATASQRLRGADHMRARMTLAIESDNIEAALEWLLAAGPSDDDERRALAWKTIRRVGPYWIVRSARPVRCVVPARGRQRWGRRGRRPRGVHRGLSNALRFHGSATRCWFTRCARRR